MLPNCVIFLERGTYFSMRVPKQWSVCGSCVKHLESYGAHPTSSSGAGAPSGTWVLRTERPRGTQLPSYKSWNYLWLPGTGYKGFIWPSGGKVSSNKWTIYHFKNLLFYVTISICSWKYSHEVPSCNAAFIVKTWNCSLVSGKQLNFQ